MKTHYVAAGVMALFLFTGTVQGYAYGDGHWDGKKAGEWKEKYEAKMKEIYQEIGLSGEQLAQIESMKGARKEEKRILGEQMKAKHEELSSVLDAPETDQARVDALVTELSALSAQKIRHRVDSVLELKGILTPEQFAALRAKKKEMREQKFHKKEMMEASDSAAVS